MKNETPFTDSMIAKYAEQVEALSPNEFGKYPYTKQALEVALRQLEMWKVAQKKINEPCGISKSDWRKHAGITELDRNIPGFTKYF